MPVKVGQIYARALGFEDYRAQLRVHASAFNHHYQQLAFVRQEEMTRAPLAAARILVLTEDYCIDSVLNVPLIARLVEASPGAELRVAHRDDHPDVAGCFLGRGGVSRLPTVIFVGQAGQALGYWSERSEHDQRWMTTYLAGDPIPDLIIENDHPAPVLADWMQRRFIRQQPLFEAQG